MSYLKKFGLFVSAIAFCLSLYVASADAQPGKARWNGNNGRHRGWQQGRRNGWNNGRKTGWQNRNVYWQPRSRNVYGSIFQNRNIYWQQNRYGRINPREYRRLQRQRARIYRSSNRYYSDGYLSDRERRRLQRQQYRYRRSVYRDRRDW